MTRPTVSFKFVPKNCKRKIFTFVDICAGIGGMRLAFESLGGRCVFSSEWDKFCQKTYFANFGEIPHGDITKISPKKIPEHDILLAGFPCQPFSKGGLATKGRLRQKRGFEDKLQGRLIFHIIEIIAKKRPAAFLLENVPHLRRINDGKLFEIILNSLENVGYDVQYDIIDSETIVPQRRKRMYIVGFLRKSMFTFPELPKLDPRLKNTLENKVDSRYTLSDRLWSWLQKHAKKHAKKGNGFHFRMADLNGTTCTLSARYGKDGSEILIPQRDKNPRKLTPRECARLMGFPDEFRIPVSDTQAYKQFGNSVVVPVVYTIGYSMIKEITRVRRLVTRSAFIT